MRTPTTVLWLILLTSLAVAQPAPQPEPSAVARIFWKGIEELNLIFKALGNLGGPPDGGEVWVVDLRSGNRRQTGATDLAWPVLTPDGDTVFAIRDGHVIDFSLPGGAESIVEDTVEWRKLLGVSADGSILGIVAGSPRARPALITPNAALRLLPQPEGETDREKVSILLQENRAYTEGRVLEVRRSARGGRGFDVFLITRDKGEQNLSDCGDERCGQPSLSPDGTRVLYVRTPRR